MVTQLTTLKYALVRNF